MDVPGREGTLISRTGTVRPAPSNPYFIVLLWRVLLSWPPPGAVLRFLFRGVSEAQPSRPPRPPKHGLTRMARSKLVRTSFETGLDCTARPSARGPAFLAWLCFVAHRETAGRPPGGGPNFPAAATPVLWNRTTARRGPADMGQSVHVWLLFTPRPWTT